MSLFVYFGEQFVQALVGLTKQAITPEEVRKLSDGKSVCRVLDKNGVERVDVKELSRWVIIFNAEASNTEERAGDSPAMKFHPAVYIPTQREIERAETLRCHCVNLN